MRLNLSKLGLIGVISLVFISTASAQVLFGIRGGASFANASGGLPLSRNSENKVLPTYHAGVLLDVWLSDNLSIQPNLLMSGKGPSRNTRR
ncbi:MAG: PorT family protein [Microscillaceae bacterium]|nr:PorT family protein [Microscillaceae bacterium]